MQMQTRTRTRANTTAAAAAAAAATNGVVVGSVWESRIKMDKVKGGIKVFSTTDNPTNSAAEEDDRDEDGIRVYRRIRRIQSDGASAAVSPGERRRRRSWKASTETSPIQLRKSLSELLPDSRGGEPEEEEVKERFDDKEVDLVLEKPSPPSPSQPTPMPEKKEEIGKQPIDLREMHPDPVTPPPPTSPTPSPMTTWSNAGDDCSCESIGVGEGKGMQSVVDLVMWKETSRSAFVFGFGAFILLSSSYAKDLDFSLISGISYIGLAYLALIFLCKSILKRGETIEYEGIEEERYVVGEDEVVWLVRLLLPYINEVLFKIRALFSGDPATTMKVAVFLFVMARSGRSITIWTLAKLAFFGVFTIPKVCSSYSVQLAKYGKFWLERLADGWESCTHKKAVAAAVFTVIWNLSSMVARIWAVFMLVVAVKYYQQCVAQSWNEQEMPEDSAGVSVGGAEDSKPALVTPGKSPVRMGSGPGYLQHQKGPTRPLTVGEKKLKKGL